MNLAEQRGNDTAGRLASAARVVARVSGERRTLDDALLAEAGTLDGANRAAVQALAYGTVRWWPRLERLLSVLVDRPAALAPPVRALLAIGLHQLEQSRHPVYAVVDESVEAARRLRAPRAAALVNAVLRRFLRERETLAARLAADPVAQSAHPQWLLERLRSEWPDRWRATIDANNAQPPLWLRVNRRRISPPAYLAMLAEAGIAATAAEHAPDAIVLAVPCDVSQLPGFERGLVSVQDAAAQLAAFWLEPRDGMRVLDACAAPGGKACHILERADVALVALDTDAQRLVQVRENLERLQLSASLVSGDATAPEAWWDGRPFERILIDVPCSATGVIRRHPDIKLLRRPTDLAPLARRQRALLRALWPLLAEGGRLLYATCSTLHAENEAVCAEFLAETPAARSVPLSLAVLGRGSDEAGGVQILPGEAGMDGFYYACFERRRN
jgi:16S rRNA (cytosine967-C5)-methyltransferase